MTEAELTGIEKAARRMLGASCDETLALVAEVRRLREALEEITRLGRGHSLDSALVVARAALRPGRS